MNPLIPNASDIAWSVAVIVNLVLVIAALVSLAKSKDKRGWLVMTLLIIFLPFIGPVLSLIATRGRLTSIRRSSSEPTPIA